jgi:hypothetical protein
MVDGWGNKIAAARRDVVRERWRPCGPCHQLGTLTPQEIEVRRAWLFRLQGEGRLSGADQLEFARLDLVPQTA